MKDGLLQLLRLQEVDKELQVLEEVRDRYPEEISVRQREIDQARLALEDQERQLEELGKEQRRLERDLTAAKVSLTEHEARFSSVTTNREYDALQQEIETCKSHISEYETQILEKIEGGQSLGQEVAGTRQTFAEVSTSQQERIDELQSKLASLQQEVDGVYARRQAIVGSVDQNLLRMYERSRKRRGMRVAPIRKGACGVCHRELPAQQRSNVRHNAQVYLCESCGAILIWDEEQSS
ncbi:MAG: C4-type zinc ribbon domain-containing protein [Candidatus Latescibacterota bacterium]|jgi:hypothetical protein